MRATRLKVKDFRNIEGATLEFSPTTNILIGENAQGKTSLIEAIYLFAGTKSFRCRKESEMIRFTRDYANIELDFEDSVREQNVKLAYSRDGRKLCKINGVNVKKMSELIGRFRCVVFCPDHLSLVREGPGKRRSFIDLAISQIKPGYVGLLQNYNKILSQRNALIKEARFRRDIFDSTIEFWSQQLAKDAEKIGNIRAEYIKKLEEYSDYFISDMTGAKERLTFVYSGNKSEEEYYKELTHNYDREIKYGATLYGPHKDDMEIYLSDREARNFASQGQQRSIALAMKLSEGEISKNECGEYPVLLLDDVLSELDAKRREYILSGIKDKQTFITSCEENITQSLTDAKCFKVKNGQTF